MGIPVIFVHKGDHFYLNFSLKQAHKANPENQIYLITDVISNRYDFVNYVDINHYSGEARKFKAVYKHMSTNTYENELFCFQRWFVLKEFCDKNNIPSFLYLDSDVLIYCKVDDYFPKFTDYTFTISKENGPQCCYFPSSEKLTSFCDFIMKMYEDPEYNTRFLKKHQYHLENNLPGGVCDMTAFYEYQADHPGCAKDLAIIEQSKVFDDNINCSDGFVMEGKIKKIRMQHNFPYGNTTERSESIQFNTLHFQGPAKSKIYKYYTGGGLFILKKKLAADAMLLRHNLLMRVMRRLGYKWY